MATIRAANGQTFTMSERSFELVCEGARLALERRAERNLELARAAADRSLFGRRRGVRA